MNGNDKVKLIIVGLDVSITSTGCVKFGLDEDFNVIEKDFMGFSGKKYQHTKSDKIQEYPKFQSYLERNDFIIGKILEFTHGCEYAFIEDYAYKGTGKSFHIGEFTGNLKRKLALGGVKMRLLDPLTLKLFATGKGRTESKTPLSDALTTWCEWDDYGFPQLIEDSKTFPYGKSPSDDIVDAWWLCVVGLIELRLRNGITRLRDYPPETIIRVFNRTTDKIKENILSRDFLTYKG